MQLKTGYVKAKAVSDYLNILFSVYQTDTEVKSDILKVFMFIM